MDKSDRAPTSRRTRSNPSPTGLKQTNDPDKLLRKKAVHGATREKAAKKNASQIQSASDSSDQEIIPSEPTYTQTDSAPTPVTERQGHEENNELAATHLTSPLRDHVKNTHDAERHPISTRSNGYENNDHADFENTSLQHNGHENDDPVALQSASTESSDHDDYNEYLAMHDNSINSQEDIDDAFAIHVSTPQGENPLAKTKASLQELDPHTPQRVISTSERSSHTSHEMLSTPNAPLDRAEDSNNGWSISSPNSTLEEPVHQAVTPIYLADGSPLASPDLESISPKAYRVVQAVRAATNPHRRSSPSKKSILKSPKASPSKESPKPKSLAAQTPRAIQKSVIRHQGLQGQTRASFSPRPNRRSSPPSPADRRRASFPPSSSTHFPYEIDVDTESLPPILRLKRQAQEAQDSMRVEQTPGSPYQYADISMADASPYSLTPQPISETDRSMLKDDNKRVQWYKSADSVPSAALTPELMENPMGEKLSPLAGKLLAHTLTGHKVTTVQTESVLGLEQPLSTDREHSQSPCPDRHTVPPSASVGHSTEAQKPSVISDDHPPAPLDFTGTLRQSIQNAVEESELEKQRRVAACALESHKDREARLRHADRVRKPELPPKSESGKLSMNAVPGGISVDVAQILLMPPGEYQLTGIHVYIPVPMEMFEAHKRILTSHQVDYISRNAEDNTTPGTTEVRPRSALKNLYEKGKALLFNSQPRNTGPSGRTARPMNQGMANATSGGSNNIAIYSDDRENNVDQHLTPIVNHQLPRIRKRSRPEEHSETDKSEGSRKRRATSGRTVQRPEVQAREGVRTVDGLRRAIRGDPSSDQNIVDRVYNKIVQGKSAPSAKRRRQAKKWTVPLTEGDLKLIIAVADRIPIPQHMANPENRRRYDNLYASIHTDSIDLPMALDWEEIMAPDAWELRKSEFEAILEDRADQVFVEATNTLWAAEADDSDSEGVPDPEEIESEPKRSPARTSRYIPRNVRRSGKRTPLQSRDMQSRNRGTRQSVSPEKQQSDNIVTHKRSPKKPETAIRAEKVSPTKPAVSTESGGFRGIDPDIFLYTDSENSDDEVESVDDAAKSNPKSGLNDERGPSQEELDWAVRLYQEEKKKKEKMQFEGAGAGEGSSQAVMQDANKDYNDHLQGDYKDLTKVEFEERMAEKRGKHYGREARLARMVQDGKAGNRTVLLDLWEEDESEQSQDLPEANSEVWDQRQSDVLNPGQPLATRQGNRLGKTVRFADPLELGPTGRLPTGPNIIKFPRLDDDSGVSIHMQQIVQETIAKEGPEVAAARGLKFLDHALAWHQEKMEQERLGLGEEEEEL